MYNELIKDKNVNIYTKILIIINQLLYYNHNYMSNTYLLDKLKKEDIIITKRQLQRILKKLEENNYIVIDIVKNKRFIFTKRRKKAQEILNFENYEDNDYNFLEED